jgi:hypothetical protein
MFEKFVEYWRLKKEYKIKDKEFDKKIFNECLAFGEIHKYEQSVEDIVVHSIDEGLFGSINYPCVVVRIASTPIDDITRLYHNPDKTFYCPKYDKDEKHPCKNKKCIHYPANQAYFIIKENNAKAWEELKKIRLARDEARIRAFGRAK